MFSFVELTTQMGYLSVVTGMQPGRPGFDFPTGAGIFSLQHRVQIGYGAHPASCRMGTGALSLWVQRPEREADHPPLSSAEVKDTWRYASTPPYIFMLWPLVE
jgi:hypothetical protein